ncbi:glycosyltransferase family 2 protein [Desulfovibrio gilichinskyi]|uniref:Glycosyltransferase, GT2 family n=1 Tax=Desulfovibrio gilichinskyi TaxID=1519643 RepID=A0A1X7DPN1_9BACT|nr:glycosyltransferase family A protein [Desulfovibrio gilichinskyi]SMF19250.1 Glycosyltransferase, GT2 family [Desulfovibrio gilichinskyi]
MSPQSINFTNSDIENFLLEIKESVPLWAFGTEEISHQRGLINTFQTFSAKNPSFLLPCHGLALWMWLQNPLDVFAARKLLEVNKSNLPKGLGNIVNSIANRPAHNIPLEDLDTLLHANDKTLIIKHLFPLFRGPDGITWLAHSWETLLRLGNSELPKTALDITPWNDELLPVKQRLFAQYSFLYLPHQEALDAVSKLDDKIWGFWKEFMKCELFLKLGEQERAVATLSALWKENIWNLNWGQKLHSLLNPVQTKNILNSSDEVSILLYSWNNAKLIENTLKNVADSRIGNAKIFALNNGSSDSTGQVIHEAENFFPKGQYHSIQLPVNVGAPAARNWLLAQPEVRKGKWAVFLDDDVELPQNWLEELLATAKQYKNPGAVGCRITSTTVPTSIQSADYHIFPPGAGTSQIEGLTERIMVFDNCRSAFDYGQFSYTRPAVHVSGCCHMLNLEAINKSGPFDVRFNPTQFDDLERDLRAYLSGCNHIYAGQLRIGHIQHSSLAKASNIKGMAQVFGNKIKLESKFSEQDINNIFSSDLLSIWSDIERKWKELAERF